jgi:transcriptional regulator with XRE-family HTH domain
MPQPRELDPSASVPAFFGAELRRHREAAGLSQERLGEIIGYSGRLIGLVETARRTPARDFAERCDAALGTEGTLVRLWPLLNRNRFPSWFREYAELEAIATEVRTYQVQVVPGLLQTEDYARAVLSSGPPHVTDKLDDYVAARMERQHILRRSSAPLFWVVLDEAVLYRVVGGPSVMRAQLGRLIQAAASSHLVLQVLPFTTGAQTSLNGAFSILCFNDGPPAVWSDGPASGQFVQDSDEVALCVAKYDLLRAVSTAPRASVEVIRSVMEEL